MNSDYSTTPRISYNNHAAIGAEIIPEHQAEVISMARRIALTHHEKWDGSGYPSGLRGEQIPLSGRIVAICDVYDALRMPRPYKAPWPIEKAQAFIREQSDKHFDPELVSLVESLYEQIETLQHDLSDCPQGD